MPGSRNERTKLRSRPSFAPFEGLGHLGSHPRAVLSTPQPATRSNRPPCAGAHGTRSRDPARANDPIPADSSSRCWSTQSPLRRVSLLEHVCLFFHTPPCQTSIVVGEFQSELTITCLVNRTLRPKRGLRAGRRRHLDSRRRRGCVVRTRLWLMARGRGIHGAGPLVHREVVDRQRLGVRRRWTAGDWADQVHASRRRRLHVLVARIERVGQHLRGQALRFLESIEHRRDRGLQNVLEEIRSDFQWLTNNGLAVQPIEHIVVHKMGSDPYATDFEDRVEVKRRFLPGDITASPLDSDTLDRVVDDLKRTFEAVAQGQLEVVLTALDGVRREVVAALKRRQESVAAPAIDEPPTVPPERPAYGVNASNRRAKPGHLF